jgi:hypothetical protein
VLVRAGTAICGHGATLPSYHTCYYNEWKAQAASDLIEVAPSAGTVRRLIAARDVHPHVYQRLMDTTRALGKGTPARHPGQFKVTEHGPLDHVCLNTASSGVVPRERVGAVIRTNPSGGLFRVRCGNEPASHDQPQSAQTKLLNRKAWTLILESKSWALTKVKLHSVLCQHFHLDGGTRKGGHLLTKPEHSRSHKRRLKQSVQECWSVHATSVR